MGWGDSEHGKHLSNLRAILTQAPHREFGYSTSPEGWLEKWGPFVNRLYVVAALMYLEDIFGEDSHWKNTPLRADDPQLFRRMEGLRCLRNCIVHNAGRVNPARPDCERILRELDAEFQAETVHREVGPYAGRAINPEFEIAADDTLIIPHPELVRRTILEYLVFERLVEPG